MHRDRHAGAGVGVADRALHPSLVGCQAALLDDALEECGLDVGVPDALLDVADNISVMSSGPPSSVSGPR